MIDSNIFYSYVTVKLTETDTIALYHLNINIYGGVIGGGSAGGGFKTPYQEQWGHILSIPSKVKETYNENGFSPIFQIFKSAFENCNSLITLVIPEGITAIGE
jgi:hypothetical protein